MNRYIIILILSCLTFTGYSQVRCLTESEQILNTELEDRDEDDRDDEEENDDDNNDDDNNNDDVEDITTKKQVRVVYHFVQDGNGNGNFTAIPDAANGYDGFNRAERWTELMNIRPTEPLAIPPNNNIPELPRNIEFVVDAVHFHQNDQLFEFCSSGTTTHNTFGVDVDEVINVYYKGYHGCDPNFPNGCHCGYVISTGANTSNKYAVVGGFNRYGIQPTGVYNHWAFITIAHEIFHLLTLRHTMHVNTGGPCDPNNQNACNDFCDDTPSPWEMVNVHNVPVDDPNCGANVGFCSNNWMDYFNGGALTPCQLNRMHDALEGGMISYTVCDALSFDNTICEIGFPKIRHFGKDVLIESCSGDVPTLESGEYNKIISSEKVEIESIEIESNTEFEIIFKTDC